MAEAAEDAKLVAGTYWSSRRPQTTIASLLGLLTQPRVIVNSDGTIAVDLLTDDAGNPKRFQEIAPLLFRERNGQDHCGFTRDYAGRLVMLLDVGITVLQPVPTHKNGKLNLTILLYSVCVFVLSLLSWPVNAALRRHYGYKVELTPRYRRTRLLLRIAGIINLAFVGFWLQLFATLRQNFPAFATRADKLFHLLQVIGLFGLLGLVVAVYHCRRSWSEHSLWLWTKIWNRLLLLAFAGYTFFVLNWHLHDFNLRA